MKESERARAREREQESELKLIFDFRIIFWRAMLLFCITERNAAFNKLRMVNLTNSQSKWILKLCPILFDRQQNYLYINVSIYRNLAKSFKSIICLIRFVFFFIGVYVRRKIKRGTEVGEICIGNLKILGKECDNALAFHLSNSLYIEWYWHLEFCFIR